MLVRETPLLIPLICPIAKRHEKLVGCVKSVGSKKTEETPKG